MIINCNEECMVLLTGVGVRIELDLENVKK